MDLDLYMTSKEASQMLGVDLRTLYTYVSRKKVRTLKLAGRRESLYWRSDVAKIAGEDAGPATQSFSAAQVSSVTLITPQGPYYRGRSAIELAQAHTLEQVASILWAVDAPIPLGAPASALADQGGSLVDRFPVHDQVQLELLAAESADESARDLSPPVYAAKAMQAIRLLAWVLTGRPSVGLDRPLHELICSALSVPAPWHDLVRRTLVLNADHELSLATCAVRALSDAGVTPYAVVSAGVAAFKGERVREDVMGNTARLVRDILQGSDPEKTVADHLQRDGLLAGFGFPLYDAEDPRAVALLDACEARVAHDRDFQKFQRAIRAGRELTGKHPDIALIAMFINQKIGGTSDVLPFSIIGRAVGWVAHAGERYAAYRHRRRRASYMGPLPGQSGEGLRESATAGKAHARPERPEPPARPSAWFPT